MKSVYRFNHELCRIFDLFLLDRHLQHHKGPSLSACPQEVQRVARSVGELVLKLRDSTESFEGELVLAPLHTIPIGATTGLAASIGTIDSVDNVAGGINVLAYETVTSEGGGVEEVGECQGLIPPGLELLDDVRGRGDSGGGLKHQKESCIMVVDLAGLEVRVGVVGETWEDVAVDHEITITFP
jgi:hypothetical protein